MARFMFKVKQLLGYFWGEAVTMAVHVLNRSSSDARTRREYSVRGMVWRATARALPAHVRLHRTCEEHAPAPEEAR
jgi:hypothetical protein